MKIKKDSWHYKFLYKRYNLECYSNVCAYGRILAYSLIKKILHVVLNVIFAIIASVSLLIAAWVIVAAPLEYIHYAITSEFILGDYDLIEKSLFLDGFLGGVAIIYYFGKWYSELKQYSPVTKVKRPDNLVTQYLKDVKNKTCTTIEFE